MKKIKNNVVTPEVMDTDNLEILVSTFTLKDITDYYNSLVTSEFYTSANIEKPFSFLKKFKDKKSAFSRLQVIRKQFESIKANNTVSTQPENSKRTPKKAKGSTIKAFAEELLLTVVDKENFEGLPYSEILKKILAKFPDAKTSLNCLRWYASKLQVYGKVPSRPRSRKVKTES